MFTVIIDADGLPGAVTYYHTFPNEPSPLGTIDCDAAHIVALHNASLLAVLRAATTAPNRDILLVCHGIIGGSGGLYIPLVANGTEHAGKEVLELLVKAETLQDKANDILNVPEGTAAEKQAKLDKWQQFFDALQKDDINKKLNFGGITGSFTTAEAKTYWEGTILPGLAGLMFISRADLLSLLQARRACVARKLQRLEIRSCDTGKQPLVLRLIRDYFGAAKATAPKLETFYHSGVRIVPINPRLREIRTRLGANPHYGWGGRGLWDAEPPWRALMPLTFRIPVLPDPLTDAPHRKEAKQATTFDVAAEIPELADPRLNDPRALGGGGRRRPADIAANGAHRAIGFGAVLFVWKFDEEHFLYDAVLGIMSATAGVPAQPGPQPPARVDGILLNEFVQERINKRGAHGLRFIPIAGLWNPDSGTEPFFLPLDNGYLASIVNV